MEHGTWCLLFLLLLLACFRLTDSLRWVARKGEEPTKAKQAGTLFVVGEDKEEMVQTWLENLGLWEAMDWKRLYHVNGNDYTTIKLTETNLEAAVFHLGNFGAVGKLTEDACFYHPFIEALEEGHWIVLIPIVVPSCTPDEELSRQMSEIDTYKLILAYHTTATKEFGEEIGNLTGGVTSVNLSSVSPVPDRQERWAEFSKQRRILNVALNGQGNETGLTDKKGWPIVHPVCHVKAQRRSECVPGTPLVRSEVLHQTKWWKIGDVDCASFDRDSRTCPNSFPYLINEETTTQTWSSTTLNLTSSLTFTTPSSAPTETLTSTNESSEESTTVGEKSENGTALALNSSLTTTLISTSINQTSKGNKSLEAEESDLKRILIASGIGLLGLIMSIGIAILTFKILKTWRERTRATTETSDGSTPKKSPSLEEIDNKAVREPTMLSQESKPPHYELLSPTHGTPQSYELSTPLSPDAESAPASHEHPTDLKTGTGITSDASTEITRGRTLKTTGTTKTGMTTDLSPQLPTPHPGSIQDSTPI